LLGDGVVVHRQPAADVGEAVLLGAHRHAVGERRDLADDVRDRSFGLARLPKLDEPGILGEPAAVEEKWDAVAIADGPHRPEVLERHGLPAARVVRDRDEDDRHPSLVPGEEGFEGVDVHVALERMDRRRIAALGDDEVDGLGTRRLNVRPRGVEMGVVGDQRSRPADDREEDLLRGAALMGRDDVLEREERLDAFEEGEPGRRAGVAFVAVLDRCPLIARHRAGPAVREEVDEDVVGVQVEEVVTGDLERPLALLDRPDADRFDGMDAEGLDDGLPAVHGPMVRRGRTADQGRAARFGRTRPNASRSAVPFQCAAGATMSREIARSVRS
jgi:hypothetical protein